jgi:hypothetical protein
LGAQTLGIYKLRSTSPCCIGLFISMLWHSFSLLNNLDLKPTWSEVSIVTLAFLETSFLD